MLSVLFGVQTPSPPLFYFNNRALSPSEKVRRALGFFALFQLGAYLKS